MLNGGWNIRPATIHDARALAEVHVESYKSGHQDIFPDRDMLPSFPAG
jgi:hypothetical protein